MLVPSTDDQSPNQPHTPPKKLHRDPNDRGMRPTVGLSGLLLALLLAAPVVLLSRTAVADDTYAAATTGYDAVDSQRQRPLLVPLRRAVRNGRSGGWVNDDGTQPIVWGLGCHWMQINPRPTSID